MIMKIFMSDFKKVLLLVNFLPFVLLYKIDSAKNSSDRSNHNNYSNNNNGSVANKNDRNRHSTSATSSVPFTATAYEVIDIDYETEVNSENYDTINEENFLNLYVNSDSENLYNTNDESEKRESGCILGTADKYLNWWITESGKINCRNKKAVLDLSEEYSTQANWKSFKERITKLQSTNVRFLSLANNNLTAIPVRMLRIFNETLEYLSLANNPLTGRNNSNWSIFPVLPRLRELDLRNCSLQFLYSDSFQSMRNLKKLFLSNNKFALIESYAFQPLTKLIHLDLSYIEAETANGFMAPSNPYKVYGDGLIIEYGTFDSLTKLKLLDMSFTKLSPESGHAFSNLPSKLQYLSLCHTGFQIIPPRMFNNTDISILDLSGNPIIAPHMFNTSFEGLEEKLQILAFEDSNLKSLKWLVNLTKLKLLTLRGNNINTLTNDTFKTLDSLLILDLSFNHVSNWYFRLFEHNKNLIYVNLRNNNINFMTPEMFNDFYRLQFLAIGSNSFLCNCLLREFIDFASRHNCNVKCEFATNDDVAILLERDDESDEDDEEQDREFVIQPAANDNENSTQRKVSFQQKVNKTLSSMLYLYSNSLEISYNKMYQHNRKYNSHNEYRARNFNVTHDEETRGADRINSLSLTIQTEAFELICKRTGDQINCPDGYDTEESGFQLLDFDELDYRCINSSSTIEYYFHELEPCVLSPNDQIIDTEQMPTNQNNNFIITIMISIVILSILFYLICYYKWWYIRYFFILIKNATILSFLDKEKDLIKRESENENFMYDVFVSYCDENRDWVLDEFLPNIEDNQQVNVCLHERDFQVGLSILENIISCMDRSRALLLIVSENFLLSHWCQFEMHLAQYRLLETRREHLIIVLLEDIPKRKRPKTLHYLMKIKTYIKWPTGNKKHPFRSKTKTKLEKLENPDVQSISEEAAYEIEEPENSTPTTTNNTPNVPEKLLMDERKLFWRRLKKALGHSRTSIKPTERRASSAV